MEYSLNYRVENINKLARYIAFVITGTDKNRAEQKRIRARISYALATGKLEKLREDNFVEVIPFFKWAIEQWPQLKKTGGWPKQTEVLEAETGSYTITGSPVDTYVGTADVNLLIGNYIKFKEEYNILKKEMGEKNEIIRTQETQLDAYRLKDKHHREYSAKGGRNSRGKSKNY